MKKTLGAVVALALAAAVVHGATEVKSVNVVGFAKKHLPVGGVILTTCNFDPIAGGTNTLLSVFGTTQLQQAENPFNADRIWLWDTATAMYQVWAQYTDGKFYKANSIAEWNLSIEGDPAIPAGVAMWVISGTGSPAKDLAMMGEVVATATQQVSLVEGPQLVGYPFSSAVALQDIAFPASGATGSVNPFTADRVIVWNGSIYQTYALYDGDGKWYKANSIEEWNNSILADSTVQVGDGFWYVAQSGYMWTESNPYIGNL